MYYIRRRRSSGWRKKRYQPTPPEEIPTHEDSFTDYVVYAVDKAFRASVEIAAKGINIDPAEYAEACLREQENEIDRIKVEYPTVLTLVEDIVYSEATDSN